MSNILSKENRNLSGVLQCVLQIAWEQDYFQFGNQCSKQNIVCAVGVSASVVLAKTHAALETWPGIFEGWHKGNASGFFLRRCNCNDSEIYVDDSYNFCNYEATFPQSLCHFQHTYDNSE
jgi:hypothetical protein